jgi:hypothetical protein
MLMRRLHQPGTGQDISKQGLEMAIGKKRERLEGFPFDPVLAAGHLLRLVQGMIFHFLIPVLDWPGSIFILFIPPRFGFYSIDL